jgi:hypothetical protein
LRAFCRTRAGLELRIRELIGREHQAAVADLPDWHPDVAGVPEPKPRKRGKRTFESTLYYGKLTLAADETYPHLFRIHYPDGLVSPPANLTRAKDAARAYAVSAAEEIELVPVIPLDAEEAA